MTSQPSQRSAKRFLSLALTGLSLAVCASANAQKPGIHGLIAMGPLDFNDSRLADGTGPDNTMTEALVHPGVYNGVVIQVTWQQLQPTDTNHIDFTAITNAIATIKTYNQNNPSRPLKGKLRVFSGVNAPMWVLGMTTHYNGVAHTGSAHVITKKGQNGKPDTYGDIPQFWTDEYHMAFQNLQNKLAAQYDSFGGDNALIQDVAVSSCSSLSAEAFILPIHNSASLTAVENLGYNDTQIKACFDHAVTNDATGDYFAWKNTPLFLPFSVFSQVDNPPVSNDVLVTPTYIKKFRAQYLTRAIVGNNAIQDPIPSSQAEVYNGVNGYGAGPGHSNDDTYPGIQDEGGRVSFQTLGPTNLPGGSCVNDDVCSWNDVVENTANGMYHATEMEIWFSHDAYQAEGKLQATGAPISLAMLTNWATNYNWF